MFPAQSSKPYKLTFEERPQYLYAYVEGENDSYEISRAYWDEVAEKVKLLNSSRVLIDENIVESGTFADVYKLASEIPDMGFGRAKLAFVDRFLGQSDINEFGELVALNRGANGRVFNDIRMAEEWLLADSSV